MKRLAIIGSADLGQQIAWHAGNDGHYDVVGYFDDFEATGTFKEGLPVLGNIDQIQEFFNRGIFDELLLGIGYKHFEFRTRIFKQFKGLIPFGKLVHSSAYVDSSCKLAEGVIIYPGCVLDQKAEIDENVLLNAGCVVAHHTKIGKHSFLSPGVQMAGFIETGEYVSLGIGTIVIDNLKIASGVRTGAGAVVTEDLTIPGLYLGVPARLKKSNE